MLILTACGPLDPRQAAPAGSVLKGINGEPVVPRSANRIFIPSFINGTSHASLSEQLTLRLREHINTGGRLITVNRKSAADLELTGRIKIYELQPIRYNTAGEPVLKRLHISVLIWLKDIKSEKIIFHNIKVRAFETFSDREAPVRSEIQVRDSVLEQLSRRIVVTTLKGWYTELMSRTEKGR